MNNSIINPTIDALSDFISRNIVKIVENNASNIPSIPQKSLTKEFIYELVESLEPKQVIFTSNEDLYNIVINIPNINKKCIYLVKGVEGTMVVDMERSGNYGIGQKDMPMQKPFMPGLIGADYE